jgi:7-carboxy-7-deazaguanine synthase
VSYAVKEVFLTLQGEGVHSGRRAVFLRFTGCNLWSGREQDRMASICQFCDTDFVGTDGVGGGRFDNANTLAAHAAECWGTASLDQRYIVITGGEPMLQLDSALIDALHREGFEIGVESNGTIAAPDGIDWLCISPKAGSEVVQRHGNELKLVWPQDFEDVAAFEDWGFDHWLIQPKDDVQRDANLAASLALVMERPKWRLTTQTHKAIGLP